MLFVLIRVTFKLFKLVEALLFLEKMRIIHLGEHIFTSIGKKCIETNAFHTFVYFRPQTKQYCVCQSREGEPQHQDY